MKNKKKWESLTSVIIWVFILSFSLLWMINILNYNKDINESYRVAINEYILEWNNKNIIKKLDLSNIDQNEKFYLYKNKTTKEYEVFTWSSNEDYIYINPEWNLVNQNESIWKTYKRNFVKKNDILKHVIYPNWIENLVFLFDGTNIDWLNNATLSDWDTITTWIDSNWVENAYQNTSSKKPKYVYNWIEWLWSVSFDWVNDLFKLDKNLLINNDDICATDNIFKEKSYAIVFKTGLDVSSDQVVFEQWWSATWYNFMIHDWDLYAWIHNKATSDWSYLCFDTLEQERDNWHKFKSVNLWEVLPDSTYFIMVVQDSTHKDETWDETVDDANNKLQIFLNWNLVSETDHVDPQPEHHLVGIWAVNEWNVRPWSPYNTINSSDWDGWCDDECLFFQWYLGEFISWNHALSKHEVRWIQNYFTEKWLRWKSNIIYNIVDININKLNH